MVASDYRYVAREALRGKWLISIVVTFVALLLGAGVGSGSSGGSSGSSTTVTDAYDSARSSGLFATPGAFTLERIAAIFLGLLTFTVVILFIVRLIIGSAVDLGLRLYNIRMVYRMEQQAFPALFERFGIFGKALGLRLLMNLFIFLWSLLLIVPGVIASYRYALAPYLMAQYPEMGIMEALDRSKALMLGNKARLFCLHISFIGWWFLSALALGLGFLVINPYMNAAEAAFYLELTGQLPIHNPNEAYGDY